MSLSTPPATSSDADIQALFIACWSILTPHRASGKMGPLYRAGFEKSVKEGRLHLSYDETGLLVGFMQVSLKKRLLCLSVDRVAVRESHLRRGIGTQLLSVAQQLAKDKGMPLRLRVANTNDEALQFYQKLGFQPADASALTTALVLQ